MLLYTVVFVLIEGSLASKHNCTNNPVTNGCTVWNWVMYRDVFAPDCHRHDVCYSCGSAFDLNRESCDSTFYNDLYETCATDERAGWTCYAWAKIYYNVVNQFGSFYYRNDAEDWCDNGDWHIPCLSMD